MRYVVILTVLFFSVGCQSAQTTSGPKVQVTLSDGQRIVGQLSTSTLVLEGSLGELRFATKDAGELGLVGGENVQQSENQIRLWLRNGSEFIGNWQKPSIEILMALGGKTQQIQIPIAKLKRLQFQSQAVWPSDPVFRIITHKGDDFFVDVTKTQMIFANEMGTFAPFLSEVVQLQQNDDNWRIHLQNGSVFLAKLQQDTLDLHLSMGPPRLAVPLTAIKRMNREVLQRPGSFSRQSARQKFAPNDNMPEEDGAFGDDSGGDLFGGGDDDSTFFSNEMQKNAKDQSQIIGE